MGLNVVKRIVGHSRVQTRRHKGVLGKDEEGMSGEYRKEREKSGRRFGKHVDREAVVLKRYSTSTSGGTGIYASETIMVPT